MRAAWLRWPLLLCAICLTIFYAEIVKHVVHSAVESSESSGTTKSHSKAEQQGSLPLDEFLKVRKEEFIKPMPDFRPHSRTHTSSNNAVFTCAMSNTYTQGDASAFAGTLRKSGYTGDIVVAVSLDAKPNFIKKLEKHTCILYYVDNKCPSVTLVAGMDPPIGCLPIAMQRFWMYRWWANMYDSNSWLMTADFRDFFFQSNPFEYRTEQWMDHNFVVFQEHHPIKTIERCKINSKWIRNCYGEEKLSHVGSNTVSCSGSVMGTPSAITAYTLLMIDQIKPSTREQAPVINGLDQCIIHGVDQGFHNYLLYSGQLSQLLKVKVFQQGEGPVNTLGAFFSPKHRHPYGMSMGKEEVRQYGWFRGEKGNYTIHNWSGDLSPGIHQLDRYFASNILENNLDLRALQGVH